MGRCRRGLACLAAGGAWLGLAAAAPAAEEEDLDAILGGFEEEDPAFAPPREGEPPPEPEEPPFDLSGSVEVSGSVNVRSHRSDTGTYYGGLQRLRNRGNLQLDVDLPRDAQLRLAGWAFWDAAYALRGRGDYTREVLREYELDAEVGEAWLHGEVVPDVDVTLGRQVVVWGRSESLRVLDVLNPLDNREPGRVDLEDLRRPVSMLRVDGYAGDWSATAIAIPEIRFDANPVVGSDFFPGTVELAEDRPRHLEDVELAGALTVIESGWDASLHGAWFWNDLPRLDGSPLPTRLVHDRLWLVGAGGNLTAGSWLVKGEAAYLDGLGFFGEPDEKSRLDLLLGAEYYGLADTTVVLEAVNRHLFGHEAALRRAPNSTRRDSQELALRVTRSFWRDRLHATLLAIALGWDARDGSLVRFDLDYDLRDALVVGVGVLLYQKGDLPPLDAWADNDRLLFRVKWSF